ncbi:MAG: helix-hairpin-helix domain-containing protein [Thermoflexibacter sp.]|jgi:competence ComEA-like helix-hairpin-helix protein|nr:helix-hairpin-helix domain-containing protein [Thermoflexibacter sp.]
MKRIQYLIKDYFDFSQTEVRGFIFLIFLMLILLIVPIVLKSFFSESNLPTERNQQDLELLNEAITTLKKAREDDSLAKADGDNKETKVEDNLMTEVKPFAFDPNAISVEQWKSLGLKSYLADRIVKYRSKGGRFKTKSDLMKIYGFPQDLYQRLYTYIQLPDNAERQNIHKELVQEVGEKTSEENNKEVISNKEFVQSFDINTADTAQLKKIKGIGAVLSERIVKFRDNLGGFYTIEQLKEVYGLKEEVYQEVVKYAKTSKSFEVRKIYINTADVNTLKAHPYIGYKNAQIIFNYRQQHGKFVNAEDLLKTKSIDENQLNKLKMYLVF